MINFPVSIVDNFFENVDSIRDYALTLEYTPHELGFYPGKRSQLLHEINPVFFDVLCKKILATYYDFHNCGRIEWLARSNFQLVDENYLDGWIHTDYPNILTCVIYLTPNSPTESGTSIYKLKDGILAYDKHLNREKEKNFTFQQSFEDTEIYRQKNNDQFTEIINVKNEYNRAIMFDANLWHGANNFFGTGTNARLCLVTFFTEIYVNDTPIKRVHKVRE